MPLSSETARKLGRRCVRKHGLRHMREIAARGGRKGGRVLAQRGPEYMRAIGAAGGRAKARRREQSGR